MATSLFLPAPVKQLRIQRGTFVGASAIRSVFNKEETCRPLGQVMEFLSWGDRARHFDDNVEMLTKLRSPQRCLRLRTKNDTRC